MFDTPANLLLGLGTGIVFGFLLQRGGVAKFETIIGQFLLTDWTVVKIMLTAMVVGGLGVYALVGLDLASLHVRPALLGGVLLGAMFFGIGMAMLGYCPGTCVAAMGEGHRDAIGGTLGMLTGAGAYVALYPVLQGAIHSLGDLGKATLPQMTDTSPWLWLGGLGLAALAVFWLLRRRDAAALPMRSPDEPRAMGGPHGVPG